MHLQKLHSAHHRLMIGSDFNHKVSHALKCQLVYCVCHYKWDHILQNAHRPELKNYFFQISSVRQRYHPCVFHPSVKHVGCVNARKTGLVHVKHLSQARGMSGCSSSMLRFSTGDSVKGE